MGSIRRKYSMMPVPPEQQNGGFPRLVAHRGRECRKGLDERLVLFPLVRRQEPDGGFCRGPGRNNLLLELGRVSEDEGPCREGNLIDRSEGTAKIDHPVDAGFAVEVATELLGKMPHQMDVRAGKAED